MTVQRIAVDENDILSDEERAELDVAEEDFAAGRTMSHEEAKAFLQNAVAKIEAGTFDLADHPELERATAPTPTAPAVPAGP